MVKALCKRVDDPTVPIILNGPGRVGMSFVRLLGEKSAYIKEITGFQPVLVAVTDLGKSIFCPQGLSLEQVRKWKDSTETAAGAFSSVQSYVRSPGRTLAPHRGVQTVFFNLEYPAILEQVSPAPGIVVEATPTNLSTGEPGLSHLIQALSSGFSAVTLAKGPLVVAFDELHALARRHGGGLKYSGAVAAALPTVDTAMYSMVGADIVEIEGILNGTTNFVLNSMARGMSYEAALARAQAMGVAEANPVLDVEGFDSAAKLLILANTVWGCRMSLDDVARQGITHLSGRDVLDYAQKGTPMRLVARAVVKTSQAGEVDSARPESNKPESDEANAVKAEPVKVDSVKPEPATSESGGSPIGTGIPAGTPAGIPAETTTVSLTVKPEPVPADHPFTNLPGTQKAVRFASEQMGDIVVLGGASDVVGAAASAVKDLIHLLEERRLK